MLYLFLRKYLAFVQWSETCPATSGRCLGLLVDLAGAINAQLDSLL